MNNKLLSFLGLAKKAGKLVLGMDAVTEGVSKRLIEKVLVSYDLSERSLRNIRTIAENSGVEVLQSNDSMDEIYSAIKKRVGIVGIVDKGFAEGFKKIIENKEEEREESKVDLKNKHEGEIENDEI